MEKKTVLIFEDNASYIARLRRALAKEEHIEPFFCERIEDLEHPDFVSLLKKADQFDAIVWDADMWTGTRTLYTQKGCIQAFARTITKGQPMIANSSSIGYLAEQMEAGCTHMVKEKDESELVCRLREVLNLEP